MTSPLRAPNSQRLPIRGPERVSVLLDTAVLVAAERGPSTCPAISQQSVTRLSLLPPLPLPSYGMASSGHAILRSGSAAARSWKGC